MKKILILFFICQSAKAQTHVFERQIPNSLINNLTIFKNPFNNSFYLNNTTFGSATNELNLAKMDTSGSIISTIAFSVSSNFSDYANALPFSGGFICGFPGAIPAVVKIDTSGNVSWAKTYHNPDLGNLKTVIADEPNNVILSIGSLYSTVPQKSCIILKTDFNGNIITTYKYSVTGGFSMDPDDLFKLSTGNYLFFVTIQSGTIHYNRMVIQLDSSFNVISFQTIYDCVGINYVQKPDDGFYAYGLDLCGPVGVTCSFVTSFSPALATFWTLYPDSISLNKIQPTPDGGLIIGGNSSLPNGNTDIILMKLDSSGNLNWAKSYGDSLINENLTWLAYETNDGIYVTGRATNGFLLKTDLSGKITCNEHSLSVILNGGQPSGGTNYVVTQSSEILTDSLITTSPIPGFTMTAYCDGVVGIEKVFSQSSDVNIFPNPAYTEFQISNFNFQKDDQLIFADVLGKILFTKKIEAPTSNLKLQTSNFTNGIYFLQLKTKEGVLNKKVVVQH